MHYTCDTSVRVLHNTFAVIFVGICQCFSDALLNFCTKYDLTAQQLSRQLISAFKCGPARGG